MSEFFDIMGAVAEAQRIAAGNTPTADKDASSTERGGAPANMNGAHASRGQLEDDSTLLGKMFNSASGDKIKALWYETGKDGNSEGDAALLMALAFWTRKDVGRMHNLMMQSHRVRPKWESKRGGQTWLDQEINNACEKCTKVRDMPRPQERSVTAGKGPLQVDDSKSEHPPWPGPPLDLDQCDPPPLFSEEMMSGFEPEERELLEAMAESYNAPKPTIAYTILGTVSSAISKGMEFRGFDQYPQEPLVLQAGVVSEVFTSKSTVLTAITRPIKEHAKAVLESMRRSYAAVEAQREVLQERENALKRKGAKGEDVQAELAEVKIQKALILDVPPTSFYTSNITDAELAQLLDANHGRGFICSPEPTAFESLLPQHSDKASAISDCLLAGYNGESVKQDRRGRKAYIERVKLTVVILGQPDIVREILTKNPNLIYQGATSRLLMAAPEVEILVGEACDPRRRRPLSEAVLEHWHNKILRLAQWAESMNNPAVIRCEESALDVLNALIDQTNRRIKDGDWSGKMRKIAGRTPQHAGRIAALFHVLRHGENAWRVKLTPDLARAGVAIARYSSESWAHFLESGQSPERQLARRILEIATAADGVVKWRNIERSLRKNSLWRRHRDGAVDLLAACNVARCREVKTQGRPMLILEVHPQLRGEACTD